MDPMKEYGQIRPTMEHKNSGWEKNECRLLAEEGQAAQCAAAGLSSLHKKDDSI